MNAVTRTTAAQEIDPVDVHVGLRMRTFRHAAKLSQSALGEALGVSFQQVQKYERGTNRVSASMLHHAAHALGVHVAEFFDGLPRDVKREQAVEREARVFAATPEGLRLSRAAARATASAIAAAATLLEEAGR